MGQAVWGSVVMDAVYVKRGKEGYDAGLLGCKGRGGVVPSGPLKEGREDIEVVFR